MTQRSHTWVREKKKKRDTHWFEILFNKSCRTRTKIGLKKRWSHKEACSTKKDFLNSCGQGCQKTCFTQASAIALLGSSLSTRWSTCLTRWLLWRSNKYKKCKTSLLSSQLKRNPELAQKIRGMTACNCQIARKTRISSQALHVLAKMGSRRRLALVQVAR